MNKLKNFVCLVLLVLATKSMAQQAPEPLELEYVCELKVKLKPAIVVGQTPHGLRRIVPIVGGVVEGPLLMGEILDGGADWQTVRTDGVAELEAHYQLKTNDGVVIYVKNTGLRVATPEVAARIGRGEQVAASEYYFRAFPRFEAPEGKYAWMNNALFVSRGVRNPDHVLIQVWKVK